ncbi:MAG: ATP-binding protein [Candidatus Paceibacterota bacterium]|jgi:PAS domain S-box-containing protein
MKIRNKISLSFLAIFIVASILIGVSFDLYSSRVIKKDAYAYLTSSNRARAEHIRTFIQEKKITAVVLASASVYRDFLKEPVGSAQYKVIKEKIDKRLSRTLLADPALHQTLILDKTGKVVAASDKGEEGSDKSQDDYFINAKSEAHFKSIYFSETIKGLAYAISAPVLDDNGTFLGVSVLRYSADDFYFVVSSENGLGDTEENFLINKDRFFITPSRFLGEEVILKQKVETQNAENCFDPKEIDYVTKNSYSSIASIEDHPHVLQALDYRGVDITGTHSYIPETGWCLITKVDTADLLGYRFQLILFIILILLIVGLLILLLGFFSASTITKPIGLLTQFAEKIKKGDFESQSGVRSEDEVGQLAESFDLMVKAVKDSRSNIEKKVLEQTQELQTKAKELNDQKIAILNILEDVEGEKDKTEILAKDLEKFKLAVDNASDHIVITDAEGVILYANKGVETISGYQPEEVIGKKAGSKDTWGGLMEQIFYENMWDTIKVKKQTFVGGIRNRRKNGAEYDVLASISPVLDENGEVKFFVGIEKDYTKEREIDKAKTEFVSLASHQLRTPLSAINWYAEMLLAGDAGPVNEEQKKYLQEISVGNQRMVDLVNALLNVSRLDLGTFTIEPEPTDISELAKSVLFELKSQIITKNLKIEESYDKTVPPTFLADKKLLRIIFQNLLSNAVKYTKPEGKLEVKILSMPKDQIFGGKKILEDSIVVSVSDSGIGIPAGQRDKIFSKLFRADNARESETEGTGLGLYIVQSIINQSGGEVWFDSVENKGTTFYLRFPIGGMKKKEGSKTLS